MQMNSKIIALATVLVSFLVQANATAPARPSTSVRMVGALQPSCTLGGTPDDHAYQFVPTCAGQAVSPDGRLAVVQQAYDNEQPVIEFQNAEGSLLSRLPSLSDDMPFSVSWSPDSHWFLANHHVGSFMDVLQVFEVVNGMAVERTSLTEAAVSIAKDRYPCLRRDMILPNSSRWTRDGRGVVMVTISRPDACSGDYGGEPGDWKPLWMIGDLATGTIDPTSIRIQATDGPLAIPKDGVYSER